jgi:hypothetical protein
MIRRGLESGTVRAERAVILPPSGGGPFTWEVAPDDDHTNEIETVPADCPATCACLCHTDVFDPGPTHLPTCLWSDPEFGNET